MNRIIVSFLVFFLLTGITTGCGTKQIQEKDDQKDLLRVYTSIYPLYDFAKQVGGNHVIVKNIIPPGSEPHEWEPSPQDVAQMTEADVIILSGTGVEPWADKIITSLDRQKITVINAGQNIQLIPGSMHHHDDKNAGKDGNKDPHVWLDPINAKIMVDNILAGLVKTDMRNKASYEANALQFKAELDKLHEEYQSGLANVSKKEFVTSHSAFGYLAKRYGLIEIPVRGISAENEPSPADMAAIVELARKKNINYIFFETLVNPKVSETIARELKAEVLVLNPLGGLSEQELAAGENYLSVMRHNLKNLKIALGVGQNE
ncbi:periplasmic solute binding protein [Desulforamulus reducens MI-1]|uniref:Periplasmic solute binding protein n=1 Tax=Desulforamulus reducens (strain ATCC BAA-1160 / DSM 100696 / MI-1) TaxID=349161 RepID=A4J7U8_DESRM|nr:metal ABC transporter substrate-binding protein [Desulforamulus reducens]ABO51151.1 periplasmic solute binding protein [Desulforamulus reducens MI-1]